MSVKIILTGLAMILCICKVVTDKQVDAAIQAGAHTVEAVGAATGAGTECGCCQQSIQDRIQGVARLGSPCGRNCADCPRLAQDSVTAA